MLLPGRETEYRMILDHIQRDRESVWKVRPEECSARDGTGATPSLTPDRAGQGRKHGSMTGPGWANWAGPGFDRAGLRSGRAGPTGPGQDDPWAGPIGPSRDGPYLGPGTGRDGPYLNPGPMTGPSGNPGP